MWKQDNDLQKSLSEYVRKGYQRKEILNYVERDFSQFQWSIPTLDRRLRWFGIRYTDRSIDIDTVKEAVKTEIEGPGRLLGYRAMHTKIRQQYRLNVPRDLVYSVMTDLDETGLRERAVGFKKRKKRESFISKGPNWVHSLDGHDKLMGFQNSTFPLAVYGCLDTASRKLMWLKVWTSNSDPNLVGLWYLEHLYETKMMPTYIRMDRGTETGVLATIHAFLHQHHEIEMDPTDTVLYGKSTSNQIERWWKELHERLEKFFKKQLYRLKENVAYQPDHEEDRMLLAFIMIPVIQREFDVFKEVVWNSHRIRKQKNTFLPNGIPDHIYNFPENYEMQDCGWNLTEEELEEVSKQSGVLNVPNDYLDAEFRQKCEAFIPPTDKIEPAECYDAFIFLKEKINETITE